MTQYTRTLVGNMEKVFAKLSKLLNWMSRIICIGMIFSSVAMADPSFTAVFSPDTIGPGSVSTLTYTITNDNATPATSLAYSNTLPTNVTLATPANASTNCLEGSISAPDGGATIALSGAKLGGSGNSCNITVDVTSTSAGTHTNTTGTLTYSGGDGGSGGTAADVLTVSNSLPGFSKEFSPDSIPFGGRTTLTYTSANFKLVVA